MPTCREKLLDEHPELIGDIDPHNCQICPNEYGYAPKPEYCDDQNMTDEEACKMCWEREAVVPNSCKIARRTPVKTIEEIAEKDARKILDSGTRREFDTGAVRDIQEGKGRCDLLPLDVVAGCYYNAFGRDDGAGDVLYAISQFTETGDVSFLYKAIEEANGWRTWDWRIEDPLTENELDKQYSGMFLEVAKHFEEGAKKYGEHNWKKGIPVHCYIDSAVRHYFKYLRHDMDEPHDRAFFWNIMCAIWTCKHKPELNEYLKEGVGDDD